MPPFPPVPRAPRTAYVPILLSEVGQEQRPSGNGGGRDVLSPAIWATKISAHFGDNNVAQMSDRLNGQKCSHTPSALNAGAKRCGATCHMAIPQCCYLAKGAKRPSHTTNMLTSSNI